MRGEGWPGWGASLDGRAEELLLDVIKEPFELEDVEASILVREIDFDLIGDLGMSQDPSVGCLRLVVAASELASVPDLLFELHDREEEVGVESSELIEPAEKFQLPRGVIAVVAGNVPDDRVIFLFDVTVVVLAVGATPGEGDVFVLAVLHEVAVDELPTIVGVNAQKRKGELGPASFDGSKNVATGLIFRGLRLGPGGGHIGEGERAAKVTVGTPAVMSD